ncbi:glycoside hydrolase family 73 protein [Streptococcus sp. zg-JUN1979]|uniref:glycoside hydrolase family 73 protein n=1 Tax=Streptococcus sp. zg-JUN1979 TaxID=3391450 RepID=UPI0039A4B2CA
MRKRCSLSQVVWLALLFAGMILLPLGVNHKGLSAKTKLAASQSKAAFIKQIGPEVQEVAKAYGVNPSIIIAQASLESDFGKTLLASRYHNLFATKAEKGDAIIRLRDSNNQMIAYAHYPSTAASVEAYLSQLKAGAIGDDKTYELFVGTKNDKQLAKSLETTGFSADSQYAKALLDIINRYHLAQYNR